MRTKVLSLLLAFLVVFATFGTALAQEPPAPFCGDLAAEDCALIEASQAAMLAVPSYRATGTYAATLAGLPGLPAPEVNVTVVVDGYFAADDAALAALAAVASIPPAQVSQATMENPQLLIDLAAGLDFAGSIAVEATPELAEALTAEAGGLPIPADLSLDMILLDGMFYIDLSPLASYGAYDGWIGVPLVDYLVAVEETGYFAEQASAMDPATLAQTDPSTAAGLAVAAALGDPAMFESAMTIERGEDVDAEGETAATFVTTYDLGAWLASPEFAGLMQSLKDSGAMSEADAAQLDQAMQMLPMLAPMLFEGLAIESSQIIGVDSTYLYDASFNLDWDLAGLIQMAAMSGALPPEIDPTAPAAVAVSTNVMYSGLGAEETIEAPADAAVYTVEELLPAAQ